MNTRINKEKLDHIKNTQIPMKQTIVKIGTDVLIHRDTVEFESLSIEEQEAISKSHVYLDKICLLNTGILTNPGSDYFECLEEIVSYLGA